MREDRSHVVYGFGHVGSEAVHVFDSCLLFIFLDQLISELIQLPENILFCFLDDICWELFQKVIFINFICFNYSITSRRGNLWNFTFEDDILLSNPLPCGDHSQIGSIKCIA